MKKEKIEQLSKVDKMKNLVLENKENIIKSICVVVVILAVGVFAYFTSDSYTNDIQTAEFISITIDEYLELMKSEEKQIVYIARPTCSFCLKQSPILKSITGKYDLTVYYLDTTDFWDSELQDYTEDGYKFINSAEVYKEGYGTPNTIIVQNGEVVDGVFQYVESGELVNLFKNNGFING